MRLKPTVRRATLVAAGTGTAIASICAVSLLQIEHLAGGVWAAVAVCAAGLVCALLARTFGQFCRVVPSGAGLLAHLSRAFGRRAGLALSAPYLALTLAIAGAEAAVVGRLIATMLPLPWWAGALLLVATAWGVARAGVRISYRAQAITTWLLVGAVSAAAVAALATAAAHGTLAAALLLPPPSLLGGCAAVGQALFLFAGFEWLAAHVEVAESPAQVASALRGSVAVLAAFYALAALGLACVVGPAGAPALTGAVGRLGLAALLPLALLASFTSFHGAILALSRLCAALAAQRVLPRALGAVSPRSLVPGPAVDALALAMGLATLLVGAGGLIPGTLAAAAVATAAVYAAAAWAREQTPFAAPGRAHWRRVSGALIALALVTVGAGVILDAGSARPVVLFLLGGAWVAALVLARRLRPQGAVHAR